MYIYIYIYTHVEGGSLQQLGLDTQCAQWLARGAQAFQLLAPGCKSPRSRSPAPVAGRYHHTHTQSWPGPSSSQ